MFYSKLIRPVLFRLDAEKAHDITIKILSKGILNPLIKSFCGQVSHMPLKVGKLNFRNPLGLAAGFDKNSVALRSWDAMGFGFAEVGTVTPLPQEGNPRPRIFRITDHYAVINRLGFNNCGADQFEKNLRKQKEKLSKNFIVGVNLGKNKHTELDDAYHDYRFTFEKCFEDADYFTINVSSPNTEGLRQLQQKKYLNEILKSLQDLNTELDEKFSEKKKDIFLKISPDLTLAELDDVIDVCIDNKLTGIIATNTTVSRNTLPEGSYEQGGLSGKPLREISNALIKHVVKLSEGKLIVIACGGVFSYDDFKEKIDLGASLVQIYTGLIYEGPCLPKKIIRKYHESLYKDK
ncbi:MAG: quinone-dependent dihydroorotate dehydrogenase [Ignavibacteria bacterium]|nr:quinone-dependent dihydroorotate dehydrogenase [Ignavibacteria bacterium]